MEALTTLALLLFLGFQINLVSSDTCAGDEPKWRFCDPRLSFTDDQKFPNQTCRCHNIVVFGQGDGDCASKVNGKEWCYIIGEDSNCQDKKIVRPLPPDFDFVGRSLHTSEEACKNRDIDDVLSIGNEDFLLGIELDALDLDASVLGRESVFFAPTPEACETECFVNRKVCAVWTFILNPDDESKNECHLKSDGSELADYIGTCQNQVRIQRPNPLAVSGFICRTASRNNSAACWSTVGKYPWFCFLGEDIDQIFGAGQTTSTTPSPPRPAPTVPVSRPPPTRPPTTSTRPTTSIAPPPKDSTPRPPKTPLEGQSAVGKFGAVLLRGRYRRRRFEFVNGRWRVIGAATPPCYTTSGSPDPNKPCIFPFIFDDVRRNSCTDVVDPDGKFWCSTKVDEAGVHISGQGNWGYCRVQCPKP